MTYCLLLSDSGCVNKFVHSSNCVNELNIIKLTTCHEFLLAELSRFFKKDLSGKTNKCTTHFCHQNIMSGAKIAVSDSEIIKILFF